LEILQRGKCGLISVNAYGGTETLELFWPDKNFARGMGGPFASQQGHFLLACTRLIVIAVFFFLQKGSRDYRRFAGHILVAKTRIHG
jgi:hypothetical protein